MTKQERFEMILNGKSSYAIVKYDNKEELIWVTCYKKLDKGKNWYLEAPNCLIKFDGYDLNNPEDLKFIDSYGMMIYEDKIYEIESPQTSPFLPDDFEIELVDEQYALEYLLRKE